MSYNLYLSVPYIPGEVTAPGFQNQIEVFSFSLGFSDQVSFSNGSGSSAGKPSLSDLNILKSYDKSSPLLLKALLKGTNLAPAANGQSVVLSIATTTSPTQVLLSYSLQDVFVSSVQDSGSTGGDSLPTQSISFSYGVIREQYHTLTNGVLGPGINVGYNQETNVVL